MPQRSSVVNFSPFLLVDSDKSDKITETWLASLADSSSSQMCDQVQVRKKELQQYTKANDATEPMHMQQKTELCSVKVNTLRLPPVHQIFRRAKSTSSRVSPIPE